MRKFLSGLFLFLILFSCFGQESKSDVGIKFPKLNKIYKSKLQSTRAHFITAIDVSSSMNSQGYFDMVKKGIGDFINSVPDSSTITVLAFGETIRTVIFNQVISNNTRKELIQKVSEMKASESYTDLQGMAENIVKQCHSKHEVIEAFMFTDFNNDPSRAVYTEKQWRELGDQMMRESRNKIIDVFALQLPLSSNAGRDLKNIGLAFPSMTITDFSRESLKEWFDQQISTIEERNLKILVASDLRRISEQKLMTTSVSVNVNRNVVLTVSGFDQLPSFITGFKLLNIDSLMLTGPDELVTDTVSFSRGNLSAIIGKLVFKGHIPVSFKNSISFIPRGVFVTDLDEELFQLGLEKEVFYSAPKVIAESGFVIGWNFWLFCAVAIFTLLFLFFLIKNTFLPSSLRRYMLQINDNNLISLKGTRFVIKPGEYTQVNTKLRLKIFVSRTCPFNLLIKRRVIIKPIGGSPVLSIDNVSQRKRKRYILSLYKKTTIAEGAYALTLTLSKK